MVLRQRKLDVSAFHVERGWEHTREVTGFSIEGLRVATDLYVTDVELFKKQDSNT
jgi:hypothetical protein